MRVGIVAAARTPFGEHLQWRAHELTYLAVEAVLKEAGVPFRDGYDDIVTCSSDHWDGKTLSDIEHGEVAGAHLGPGEERVTLDGANAVLLGAIKILSGHAEAVLVTACCKERQVLDPSVIENFCFDAPYQQLIGLDFTQAAALQCMRYMHRYGLDRRHFAPVVVRSRERARLQGASPGAVTVEAVLEAPMVSHPIGSLDGRPLCDGACALLLASEERARALTDRPVWITGMGSCYEAHNLGDRDLAEPRALTRAAGDAMGMAGVADPAAQIDILEISDHFSYQLPLWAEGLGLCGPGGGPAFLEAESGGRGPAVNRSGGLLRGVPRYVAGADRVTEAFRQLRGEAPGGAPLAEARRALAHGTSGPAGQHQCVIILERGF